MNKTTFISLIILLSIGSSTYFVKQRVHKLETKLARLHIGISRLEESLHVLYAENDYLSRPERLQELAENKLGLVCSNAYQVKNEENLNLSDKKTKMVHLVSMR